MASGIQNLWHPCLSISKFAFTPTKSLFQCNWTSLAYTNNLIPHPQKVCIFLFLSNLCHINFINQLKIQHLKVKDFIVIRCTFNLPLPLQFPSWHSSSWHGLKKTKILSNWMVIYWIYIVSVSKLKETKTSTVTNSPNIPIVFF